METPRAKADVTRLPPRGQSAYHAPASGWRKGDPPISMLSEELTGQGAGALDLWAERARRLAGPTQILTFLLRLGCAAAAAWYAAAYAWIVWNRIGYPFDLEWMEGAMVDHVRFLLRHGNLYV